jgi:hypothetical protein
VNFADISEEVCELTMDLSLLVAILAVAPGLASVPAPQGGGQLELNPENAHVRLYPASAPDLKFYPNRDLTGPAAIRLNDRGAFFGNELVCRWPNGQYDENNASNMVLGYESAPEVGSPKFTPCPAGFPVISTRGDRGLGGAGLYIEVSGRKGPIIEVRFRAQSYYMDLRSLPRERPDPSGSNRSVLAWQWEPSAKTASKVQRAAADRLKRQPGFNAFLEQARQCLSSPEAQKCFISLAVDRLYFPEGRLADPAVPADRFATIVWNTAADDGNKMEWHLKECFAVGDLSAGDRAAILTTETGWICEVRETPAGWKLVSFFQDPNVNPAAGRSVRKPD